MDLTLVQQQIDRLYAELAVLKRYVVTSAISPTPASRVAWQDLREAANEVSARWTGPGAVDEIRAQREK